MAWMHADLFALQEILATMDAIAQHPRQIHGQVHLRRHALVVHIAAHQNDPLRMKGFTSSHALSS
jgi:hypothetical protein